MPLSTNHGPNFARRMGRLSPSPVREILHVIEQAGMISFAGGLPAPDSFPDIDTRGLDCGRLQYGPSEGEPALRRWIAEDLASHGLSVGPDQILILSGSQQGIDLVAKMFVDTGTRIGIESPTYLAAVQVFNLFGARHVTYHPAAPQQTLAADPPRLVYSIPTFQNPTGHVYSLGEREALAAVCDRGGSVLFEDDPYRELVYTPCERKPICALLKKSDWIYQSSFSKTIAPGLRVGYLASSLSLFPYLTRLKQAADLHSNRIGQQMVLAILNHADNAKRMARIIAGYRAKRDHFHTMLTRYFNGIATWEIPRGGLFFWLRLVTSTPLDTRLLLPPALQRNVAFMPGEPFYPNPTAAAGAIRLNFSHADSAQTAAGLAVLAELIGGTIAGSWAV